MDTTVYKSVILPSAWSPDWTQSMLCDTEAKQHLHKPDIPCGPSEWESALPLVILLSNSHRKQLPNHDPILELLDLFVPKELVGFFMHTESSWKQFFLKLLFQLWLS